MSVLPRSDARQPRFVIGVLRADDTDTTDQAAALLVEAFPRWLPTLELAQAEVTQALAPDRICLVARAEDEILGWVGAIPGYSHAWELHPLVVRADSRRRGIGRALVTALEERIRLQRAPAASSSFQMCCPTQRTCG